MIPVATTSRPGRFVTVEGKVQGTKRFFIPAAGRIFAEAGDQRRQITGISDTS
jgi:hypothetical protein